MLLIYLVLGLRTTNIQKNGDAFSGYRKKLSTADVIYQWERIFDPFIFSTKKPAEISTGFSRYE